MSAAIFIVVFPLCVQCDIDNQQVDQSVLDSYCGKHSIIGW